MVSWLIIGVFVLLLVLFLKAKFSHFSYRTEHKLIIILVIAFALFFYTTGSKIIKDNNVDVGSLNGMVTAGKLYFSWLGHAFTNVKEITGKVVNLDWGGNSSSG